ncbi:MAG TPA: LCP family protein [Streptosporangiaceae bacterium]|jgi:LCP family protein required for cell wall assembly|nr:LCP family protein [Streptosporangiaceae bacterium]
MSKSGDMTGSQGSARTGRGTRSAWKRVFGWVAAALALVLVVASLSAYLKFRSVWDSIHRVTVTGLGPQPPKFTSAMNILLIGSDSRAGANRKFGAQVTGQRSDTIIILHIAPADHGVIVLSIPRDSVVPVLSCPAQAGSPGQTAQPGQVEQINSTFAYGGPGCLWKTIEQTTHLHLDHFIELNFTGFEKVIDDVGGVSICLPFPVNDPLSKLHLSRGRHHVYGAEALAFWRARYIGEGSDLQRIRRDQYLMASILQGVEHSDLTSNPARILSVITDAAKSMTTDAGLSLSTMITIVDSLRSLRPGAVQFVELPTVAYPQNPDWVSWPASDAALFSALAHDRSVQPAASEHRQADRGLAAAVGRGQVRGLTATRTPAAHPTGRPAAHPTGRPAAQPPNLARTYGGITGGTNVCHDSAAFAGPRGGS